MAPRPDRVAVLALGVLLLQLLGCSSSVRDGQGGVVVTVRDDYASAATDRVDRYRLRVFRRDAGTRRWQPVLEHFYFFPGTSARGISGDGGVVLTTAAGSHALRPASSSDDGPILVEAQGGLAQASPAFVAVGLPAVAMFAFPHAVTGQVDLALDPLCRNVQSTDTTIEGYFRTCVAQSIASGGTSCPVFLPICWRFDAHGVGAREACACGAAAPDAGAASSACGAPPDAGATATCPDNAPAAGDGGTPFDASTTGAPVPSGTLRDRGACTEDCARDGNWSPCVGPPVCGTVPATGEPCCGAQVPAACPGVASLPGCGGTDRVCTTAHVCAACGAAGQPCCAGASCAGAGVACGSDAVCHACGAVGQPCCAGAGCAGAGVACGGDAVCHACGAHGTACCPGNGCASGDGCYGGVCTCGGGGQVCCPGGGCTAGGTTCDPAGSGTCVGCGAQGQPCCAGACASSGNICAGGQCVACGADGQSCCGGAACATTPSQQVDCYFGICRACGLLCEKCCYAGASRSCNGSMACDNGRGRDGTCCDHAPCTSDAATCNGGN